jgi:glycosyltransferase involved in cell wall biosynthesis
MTSARPLRIVLVTKGLDIGGLERVVVDLANGLVARGDEVDLAVVNDRRDALVGALSPEVRVHRLGGGDRIGWSAARRLRTLVVRGGFDVVHAHGPLPAVLVRIVRGGPRVVTSEHTPLDRLHPLSRLLWLATARRDAATIAVSDAVRASLPASTRVRTSVVPHGVDVEAARRVAVARRRERGDAPVVVLMVARHVAVKHHADVLHAVRAVRSTGTPVRLVALGDGPLLPQHRLLARQLGIDDIVEFRAPVGDVFDAMADSDVLVMASEREGQPLVVAEALAAGLPVVATAVGRVPDLVDPTVGRVVPPGDREALARALTEVVCD